MNLALQNFLQAMNFRFTQTAKCLQPVIAMRIFLARVIKKNTKFASKWPTVSLTFNTFVANSSTELSGSCSA